MLVNEKQFMQVARLLQKAVIVDFYGVGASSPVAIDAQYKFMRIGKNVITYQLYDRQYVQAVNSDASHVGIIISYSGETKEMLKIAGILLKNGTPVVAVTSSGENSLNRIADYNLSSRPRRQCSAAGPWRPGRPSSTSSTFCTPSTAPWITTRASRKSSRPGSSRENPGTCFIN